MKTISSKWKTHKRIIREVWSMLNRGVDRFNDPFHWPVLGTVGAGDCQQRSVILRQFDPESLTLACYTDARASKVQDIRGNPAISWLFYHPRRKIQVRIQGRAELHNNDSMSDRQWQSAGIPTRLNFCAGPPPGSVIDQPASGLPHFMLNRLPTLIESEQGRQHFMSIVGNIETLDWLLLSPLGNRRARFAWSAGEMQADWLVP